MLMINRYPRQSSLIARVFQSSKRFQSALRPGTSQDQAKNQPIVHGPADFSYDESSTGSSKTDLHLLEQGIKRTDELTSQFTDYTYRFKKLPLNYGSNQLLSVDKELQKDLDGILSHFNAPIRYAFGYGSGVFQQTGYSKGEDSPQMDLIFGVTHPDHFHSLNIRQNPHHYSSLRYFGSEFVSKFQDIGAGIYFNPFVDINGHSVKYGVVSMNNLLKDLASWNSFYLAGRLQKPVKVLKNDCRVQYWNQLNLKAAATLAKHLTLRENNNVFDEFNFYKQITALSYAGDVRYKLGGENPNKINNIVEKNLDNFRRYYKPVYKDVVLQNSSYLPQGFTLDNSISLLEKRIYRTSTIQALKGIFTAGITKSVKYAWAKKLKAMKGSK
ncbi:LAFE_0G02366g1_1 [Lachancea fermentati]|uniref:Phosphatidate cytidylyltransferase, mitochondrial n=1 Tax=Lachancea fermentati TaxID=4955 RepID=A0A1G4MGZ4_LACFM|nr:LAFE_0G02366g1_1 [Lachancea fermentati]